MSYFCQFGSQPSIVRCRVSFDNTDKKFVVSVGQRKVIQYLNEFRMSSRIVQHIINVIIELQTNRIEENDRLTAFQINDKFSAIQQHKILNE